MTGELKALFFTLDCVADIAAHRACYCLRYLASLSERVSRLLEWMGCAARIRAAFLTLEHSIRLAQFVKQVGEASTRNAVAPD